MPGEEIEVYVVLPGDDSEGFATKFEGILNRTDGVRRVQANETEQLGFGATEVVLSFVVSISANVITSAVETALRNQIASRKIKRASITKLSSGQVVDVIAREGQQDDLGADTIKDSNSQ